MPGETLAEAVRVTPCALVCVGAGCFSWTQGLDKLKVQLSHLPLTTGSLVRGKRLLASWETLPAASFLSLLLVCVSVE